MGGKRGALLFWLSAAIGLYTYAGYPLILAAGSRRQNAPPERDSRY
jgi:hypothetical protein